LAGYGLSLSSSSSVEVLLRLTFVMFFEVLFLVVEIVLFFVALFFFLSHSEHMHPFKISFIGNEALNWAMIQER